MSQLSAEPPGAQPATAKSEPLLTIVRGDPTAPELAALTVVVGALARRASQRVAPERPAGSRWTAKDQLMRPHVRPGPGAWRASALPR